MLNKSSLASALHSAFSDVSGKDARTKADRVASAIYDYAKAGKPMCTVTTLPGFGGLITGNGIGGIDKPAPGPGLLLPALKAKMMSSYELSRDPRAMANRWADAIHSYFSLARVQTMDLNGGPPSIKGLGGLDKPSPGMGLSAAKPLLANDLYAVFSEVGGRGAWQQKIEKIASAIHKFCGQAIVKTDGNFTAVPVPVPPGPPNFYTPGAGTSKGELK